MSHIIKVPEGGDFAPAPEGTHLAICNMIVDMGLQEANFEGKVTNKYQTFIRWEIPSVRIEWEVDGKKKEGPVIKGKTYTNSLHEKSNLRRDLTSWLGRGLTVDELHNGFDVFGLLGSACLLTITHNKNEKTGRVYANISAISALPQGMASPKGENPLIKYSQSDPSQFDQLQDWLQEKIKNQVNLFVPQKDQQGDPGVTSEEDYGTTPKPSDFI